MIVIEHIDSLSRLKFYTEWRTLACAYLWSANVLVLS